MKLVIFLFFLMLMITETCFSQTMPPALEPGVSQALAKWRAAHYSDVRYKLNITLEKQAPSMHGEIEIRVNLTEEGAQHDLILDWRTTPFQNDQDKSYARLVWVNGGATTYMEYFDKIRDEHLIIAKRVLKKGENVFKIEFASPIKTSGAAVTRYVDKEDGAEYVYSLFVSSDASTAFPVFDQPDLKAVFQLSLTVPYGWKVVTNSVEEDYTGLFEDDKQKIVRQQFSFQETKPISTYVFAFAAGEFWEFPDAPKSNLLVKQAPAGSGRIYEPLPDPHKAKIYVRKSQAEKFQPHQKEVFRLNRVEKDSAKNDIVLLPGLKSAAIDFEGLKFLSEDSVIK